MNDYEFTFKEDVREKKAAGRGAYAKKGGSKSKRCSLPSDNLTPAQKRALNGEVKTYDLNEPIAWDSFKKMPTDLQEEYIRLVTTRFGVTCTAVDRELFGNGRNTLTMHAKKHGVKLPTRRGVRDNEVYLAIFRRWINGELTNCTDTVSEEPEEHFTIDAENISVGVIDVPATRFPLKTATLQMEGDADELVQALQLFLCGRSAELEISIKFKEEN